MVDQLENKFNQFNESLEAIVSLLSVKNKNDEELPVTYAILSEETGVPISTLRGWYEQGKIPGHSLPGGRTRVMFYRSEVNNAIRSKSLQV